MLYNRTDFRKENYVMEKETVEKFKKEERPVWFLGRRTAMPIKGKDCRYLRGWQCRRICKIRVYLR